LRLLATSLQQGQASDQGLSRTVPFAVGGFKRASGLFRLVRRPVHDEFIPIPLILLPGNYWLARGRGATQPIHIPIHTHRRVCLLAEGGVGAVDAGIGPADALFQLTDEGCMEDACQ
jgi:hypothetical protein